MHQDIHNFLQKIGLTETEIKLYINGLTHGSVTAAEYAKQTGIKRTTVYSSLASLEQKGIASVFEDGQKRIYTMQSPEMFERQIGEQIEDLQNQKYEFSEVLPLFDRIESAGEQKTAVQQFTGEQGVRTAIDQALFCKNRAWKIIAPTKNYFFDTDDDYSKYFIATRKQRSISAKSLWEPSFVKSRKFSQTTIDARNPRVLAKEYVGKFTSTVILFDTKVLYVSSSDQMTAIVIDSPEMYSTMDVFFDGVWNNSKKVSARHIKQQK